MASKIQIRRDTAANWTATNPTLAQGEPGLETNTNRVKYGDGSTPWVSLEYSSASAGGLTETDITNEPLWIAVNSAGGTSYSHDAETWTPTYEIGMGEDNGTLCRSVAIGPDAVVYVAQASNGDPCLFYAPNVQSKPVELVSTLSVNINAQDYYITWLDVIYGGGYYVACGYLIGEGPNGPAWAYSEDGYNWTIRGYQAGGEQFNRVAYNGTGWLFGAINYNGGATGDGYFVSDITTPDVFSEPTWTDELNLDLTHVGWSGNSWVAFDGSAADYKGIAKFSSNANVALTATPTATWSANSNVAAVVYDTLKYIPDNEGDGFIAQASGPITFEGNTSNWHMFGAYTGAVAATRDNGVSYVVSVPAPYTANIVAIDAALSTIEIPSSVFQIWDGTEAELITISNASVAGYNGTYYTQYLSGNAGIDTYTIYTNPAMTTLANASAWNGLGQISGNAALTWSHGWPITGMAIVGNVAFVGNLDDDLLTSTDLQTWTRVVDNNDITMTGFVDVAYRGSSVAGSMPATGNIQLTGAADWYIGDPVTFTIVNAGDELYDVITANVVLTRGDGTQLYNDEQESPADPDYNNQKVAPKGTVWNTDGWDDFSNVRDRSYTNFYRALAYDESSSFTQNIVGALLVMKDIATDRYFAIKFTGYGNGDEPYLQYTRREINPDYQPGIRFADGTTQITAYTPVLARHTSPGYAGIFPANEWRCEQVSGMKVIDWPGGDEFTSVPLQANIAGGNSVTIDAATYAQLDEALTAWDNDSNFVNNPPSLTFSNTSTVYRITGYNRANDVGTINFTSDSTPFRPTANVGIVSMTIGVPAAPVLWWDAADLPNGPYNFRGAVIDYHAFASDNAGNFIGQIMIAKDDSDNRVTHSETQSGFGVEDESFWERPYDVNNSERKLYYRGSYFNNETVIVQWTAKVFYGSETKNHFD